MRFTHLLLVLFCLASPLAFAGQAPRGAIIENESHDGKIWQRIRVVGPGALSVCKSLNLDIENKEVGAILENDSASCLVSPDGPVFGFIAGPQGEIVNLEAFGYN